MSYESPKNPFVIGRLMNLNLPSPKASDNIQLMKVLIYLSYIDMEVLVIRMQRIGDRCTEVFSFFYIIHLIVFYFIIESKTITFSQPSFYSPSYAQCQKLVPSS